MSLRTCETLVRPCQCRNPSCAAQVQLNKPGSAEKSASVDNFVAVGIGILVSEDWLSLGCVQLFKAHEETTVNFKGETVKKWQIAAAYRREFSGPVTAISSSNGNLVVAYSHRVRICFNGLLRPQKSCNQSVA